MDVTVGVLYTRIINKHSIARSLIMCTSRCMGVIMNTFHSFKLVLVLSPVTCVCEMVGEGGGGYVMCFVKWCLSALIFTRLSDCLQHIQVMLKIE